MTAPSLSMAKERGRGRGELVILDSCIGPRGMSQDLTTLRRDRSGAAIVAIFVARFAGKEHVSCRRSQPRVSQGQSFGHGLRHDNLTSWRGRATIKTEAIM